MELDPEQYSLKQEEHQRIFDQRIKPEIFKDYMQPASHPVAVILGGQPGAGKSGILQAAFYELSQRGATVQIVGDNFRKYHPQYAELQIANDKTAAFYTDRDSGRWVEKTLEEAKKRRVNIVIEGTMRSSDVVAKSVEKLRPEYEIDVRVLAVKFSLSEQGILLRYEGQKYDQGIGRWTTPEAHRAGYEGVPATIERIEHECLADRIKIYKRSGQIIYSNELKNGKWVYEPQARYVMALERDQPLTTQEQHDYLKGFDQLSNLLTRPDRAASLEEISQIEKMRQRARNQGPQHGTVPQSIRPERVVAFEKLPKEDALREYPELVEAYKALDKGIECAQRIYPGKQAAQNDFGREVKQHISKRLVTGETKNFAYTEKEKTALKERIAGLQKSKTQEPKIER